MLQLILGRSGYGKTDRILEQVTRWVQENSGPIYLLVPEQFSFETERTLLNTMGAADANRVQVISFSRLAETLCPPIGGKRMDNTVRTLMMSEALVACIDQLSLYRGHVNDPDYISCLLSLLVECKQEGISPALLQETAMRLPENALKNKTQELSLILAAYEAQLEQSGLVDPLDDLERLVKFMQGTPLPNGAKVAVDGFHRFSGQEMAVLRCMIGQADEVTVALCTDTLDTKAADGSPFAPVTDTANHLIQMARTEKVTVASPVILTSRQRTDKTGLNQVEKHTYGFDGTTLEENDGSVHLLPCEDVYDECDRVARMIRQQIREKDPAWHTLAGSSVSDNESVSPQRYRDVAIVVRGLDNYKGVLDAALDRQSIPYYLDSRQNVMTDSLFALTMAAVQIAGGDWSTDLLLRIAKSRLVGLSSHSVALLENYAYTWRINGSRWRQDWVDHPDGLSAKFDDNSRFRLQYINRLRRRLIIPLERLSNAIRGNHPVDGEVFAKAIYRYLLEVGADRLLGMQVKGLRQREEHPTAERLTRLWPLLMGVLDTFASTLKNRSLSVDRLVELFRLVVSATDLGDIPQTLDSVQIGAADRIRYAHPKTVFVLGMNEGVFPAYPSAGNLWSHAERCQLKSAGLPLCDTNDEDVLMEWLYAYYAISAPSERLVISWVKGNAAGETLLPSSTVEQIKLLLPKDVLYADNNIEAESPADMLGVMARQWQSPTTLTSSIKEVLEQNDTYKGHVQAIARMADDKPAAFEDDSVAKRFFGEDMRLSPSRVDRFYQCRFAYFCQYGLQVNPRRPAELDSLEFGTMAHHVMEVLLPVYTIRGVDGITREDVRVDVNEVIDLYVDENMGGIANRPARFLNQVEQLKELGQRLMWQVVQELRQSRFVPTDFELPVGSPDGPTERHVESVVMTLPDGGKIRVQGKIDRVDVCEIDGVSYVRVIDYKTGDKKFKLSEVIEGINLQMLIYLMSIWQNGQPLYGEVRPAGLLYLPAKLPVVKLERDSKADPIKEELKTMKMNGLILDDPQIVEAMEASAAGIFIPAWLTTKQVTDSRSSVASLAEFGRLKKRMEKLLTSMATTLRKGDIGAVPAYNSDIDACKYCDFKAVCGFEEGMPVRTLAKMDAKEVLEMLRKEDTDGTELE